MSSYLTWMRHPIASAKSKIKKAIKAEVARQGKGTVNKETTSKEDASNFQKMKRIKGVLTTVIHDIAVANTSLEHYEIALYFSGGMGNIYQVEQWIGPLMELNKEKKIVLIVRVKAVYQWLAANTDFVVVHCRTIEDVLKIYEENHFKCVLYVNHGYKNFQSLIIGDALHVHINHGESDKTSTITNQSKAYDYTFIVGEAAHDKYKLNLIKKNLDNFIQIGRPQLDHIEAAHPFDAQKLISEVEDEEGNITIKRKSVILYAPTWEGTHESMNFTSLDDYGMSLVQQLVNHPDYYLVYKPHPNTGSRQETTGNVNKAIIKMLNAHESGEAILEGDINGLYTHIDLAIFDNSAVAIDYLLFDKPMIMTDMFHRIKDRKSEPTITKAARMLSIADAYSIPMIVADELENDTAKEMRNRIKLYFLGDFDYTSGESTEKFVSEIVKIIEERDTLVNDLLQLNQESSLAF